MTNEFSPTCGLTRKKRRPRLTMRLHPRGGDLLADATGRESLCRHPQFAPPALRAAALKWTNVVRSVRSSHSPCPHKESLRPGRDPAVAPKGAPVDPARLGCRSSAQRKPRSLTATGPPSARAPKGYGFRHSEGSPSDRNPQRSRTHPAIPRRTTRVPSFLGQTPTNPGPPRITVSRHPWQPARPGNPSHASLAWAEIAFLGDDLEVPPRLPLRREAPRSAEDCPGCLRAKPASLRELETLPRLP
jgi:hypothetical protein